MSTTMGRRREKNLDLPPRMQQKGNAFYYVTSTKPRQWIALGSDLDEARKQWAILENGPRDESLVENLVDKWLNSDAFDQLAPSSRICYESVSKQVKAFSVAPTLPTSSRATWRNGWTSTRAAARPTSAARCCRT